MGTTISLFNYAEAVDWLQSNVGKKIKRTFEDLRGDGWCIKNSYYHVPSSSTPYMPVYIVYIIDRERAVEFALIFGTN